MINKNNLRFLTECRMRMSEMPNLSNLKVIFYIHFQVRSYHTQLSIQPAALPFPPPLRK